jgi:hypothetical protein
MSNSTNQPSPQQQAAGNPSTQTTINNTLAVFLADHNLPVPDCLKCAAQGKDH